MCMWIGDYCNSILSLEIESIMPICRLIDWCCYKWTYLELALLWLVVLVEDFSIYYNSHPYVLGWLFDRHDSNLKFSLLLSIDYSWMSNYTNCLMLFNFIQTWLILPVVICLSQRLSHACICLSICICKLWIAHYNSHKKVAPLYSLHG